MASFKLPWPQWGPPKLRANNAALAAAINDRTPIAGLGIDVDQEADGMVISTEAEKAAATARKKGSVGGGSSSGTPVDIYGSLNGAPAVFHLLQTSAPTPIP